MEKTPDKNNKSGKSSLITVLGFLFILIFIGGLSLVFIKQNADISSALSTLSASQSQFMSDLSALSAGINSMRESTAPTTEIPIHTIDIREPEEHDTSDGSAAGLPESAPQPTAPEPVTPEATTPQATSPAETTPKITSPEETSSANSEVIDTIQYYISMYLGGGEYRIPIIASLPKHDYKWENVVTPKNGLKYYTVNNKKASYAGVDVSSHQKDIDWAKVKAAGVDFAIIRVGFRGYGSGALVLDDYFEKNMQGALNAGIKVGVYFFSQAINEQEAEEEAELVLEQIKNYKITYPVVYDAEDISNDTARTDGLPGAQITSNCIAFCEKIKAGGYTPMIYANKRWFLTRLDLTRLTDYDLWHAAYVDAPDTPYLFTMWQYTSTGKVDGIDGNVDLNISFVDYSKR